MFCYKKPNFKLLFSIKNGLKSRTGVIFLSYWIWCQWWTIQRIVRTQCNEYVTLRWLYWGFLFYQYLNTCTCWLSLEKTTNRQFTAALLLLSWKSTALPSREAVNSLRGWSVSKTRSRRRGVSFFLNKCCCMSRVRVRVWLGLGLGLLRLGLVSATTLTLTLSLTPKKKIDPDPGPVPRFTDTPAAGPPTQVCKRLVESC